MTIPILMPLPKQQFLSAIGAPLSGGQLFTYDAGTTNPKPTYTDAAGTIAQANPITLNARGEPASPIFWSGAYKVEVRDALGNVIYTVDNFNTDPSGIMELFKSTGSLLIGFIQAGAGAVGRWVQDKLRGMEVDIADFGGVGDGATSVATAANNAITYLASIGGGTLRFGRGTYVLKDNEKINLIAGNITLRGHGQGATVIKRTGAGGTALIEGFSTADKANITISDLTIDCNGINSGVQVQYVSRFTVRNCAILNSLVWGISIGIGNGASSVMVNTDLLIDNCLFSGALSTTEPLLLFNSRNVKVVNSTFKDSTTANTPAIGLYQNLRNVVISKCNFYNVRTGIYFSQSTDDIVINDCSFDGCSTGITGANQADNGTFGATFVLGLVVSNSRFYNNDSGLIMGAVLGACVRDCIFRKNLSNAMVIGNGNAPVAIQAVYVTVSGCHFIDNNAGGGNVLLHPGILFSGTGSALTIALFGCSFIDTRAVPLQVNPIAFTGAFNWSLINLFGCTLNCYPGGSSLALSGGATLTNIKLYGCMNTANLPAGVTST